MTIAPEKINMASEVYILTFNSENCLGNGLSFLVRYNIVQNGLSIIIYKILINIRVDIYFIISNIFFQ